MFFKRIHGAYVSETEISKVSDYLRDQKINDDIESILLEDNDVDDESEINETSDELYNEAVQIVKETKKTSISFLRKKLKLVIMFGESYRSNGITRNSI